MVPHRFATTSKVCNTVEDIVSLLNLCFYNHDENISLLFVALTLFCFFILGILNALTILQIGPQELNIFQVGQ